jgi:hypothetical protein
MARAVARRRRPYFTLMPPPGRRLALLLFAMVVAAWMVLQALTGVELGLSYLAPALVLCAPLALGWYVGENQLAELADRSPRCPARRFCALPLPRSYVRVMQRGGRLVAASLAKRPPPVNAAFVTA